MVHMYSVLLAKSFLPFTNLQHSGQVADIAAIPWSSILPSNADVQQVKQNLVVLVAHHLTQFFKYMAPLSKSVPQHIHHKYSQETSKKSEVFVVDVLMKSKASHSDIVNIMKTMQGYLGDQYPPAHRVASGGDQLTCERQVGAQRHLMDSDTPHDHLQLLEPQSEDWHCLVTMLSVSQQGATCTCRHALCHCIHDIMIKLLFSSNLEVHVWPHLGTMERNISKVC